MKEIFSLFFPLFVAVDPIGILPLFISLTASLDQKQRRKIIRDSFLTASLLGTLFIAGGRLIFQFLRLTPQDFMIAGGILLFSISLLDLISTIEKPLRRGGEDIGVVPLGIPLMVGPAVLTISLIQVEKFGIFPTIVSLIVNLGIAAFLFLLSDKLLKLLGRGGMRALSKISSLFLAAIGIMITRQGIMGIINY